MQKILVAVLMCFAVLGCKEEKIATAPAPTVKGVEYTMVDAPNGATITLTFSNEDNRYFGQVVNRYFGTYEMGADGKLTLSGAASTLMMGPNELMQTEQFYLQNLVKTIGYKTAGDQLILILSDGSELTFKPTNK